ncbi:hypothetical protein [Hymenobacter coccineus]|uniref:Uncharacterized protein n=1 Tax=Hymenobacter coccineus TaxID=1908235 RepID=A0A1G1TDK0_9BACT|nr:hypothetical protein [Hymenobacter coccineus]OGX88953.1 hypothetical protein BEN49_09825 [Hymenobacter coccineus]
MRKVLCCLPVLFACAGALPAQAQKSLAGTAWVGTASVPEPTEVVLQFKQDTVFMFVKDSKQLAETMHYTQKGNHQFVWQKISGGSPCDTQTPGTWAYKIKKDEIMFTPVNDPCPGRTEASLGKPFKKTTWPQP